MIVDANPIVTACLGHSEPLFHSLIANGYDLFAPEHQLREARLVTAAQAPAKGRDPVIAFAWAERVVRLVPVGVYGDFEREARARLQPAGQKDWPLLALALASGDEVWSNDVDLFGTGVIVWNSYNIRRMALPNAAAVGANED